MTPTLGVQWQSQALASWNPPFASNTPSADQHVGHLLANLAQALASACKRLVEENSGIHQNAPKTPWKALQFFVGWSKNVWNHTVMVNLSSVHGIWRKELLQQRWKWYEGVVVGWLCALRKILNQTTYSRPVVCNYYWKPWSNQYFAIMIIT